MKGLRSFLVLLVVAAALGGFLYYDSKREPASPSKLEKVFAAVEADKIEQVTVTSVSGEKTTVQKQGTAWQVTAPAAVAADEAELSGITSNLASLEVQRVVDDQATDFKQYGLEPGKSQRRRSSQAARSRRSCWATRRRPGATCTRGCPARRASFSSRPSWKPPSTRRRSICGTRPS